MYVYMYVCIYVYMYLCIYVYMYICMRCMCVYIMYIRIHAYMCICVYTGTCVWLLRLDYFYPALTAVKHTFFAAHKSGFVGMDQVA